MPEAEGERGECRPEGRFSTNWGPGRRQEPGRRQARSRNSLPALSAAAVVQAMQLVQCVLRKRTCVLFGGTARSEIIPRRSRDKPPRPPDSAEGCAVRWGGSAKAKRVAEDGGSLERQGLRGAERLGGRCSVCGRSAGVSLRTHLRWPTPVRQLSDRREYGRDFQIVL